MVQGERLFFRLLFPLDGLTIQLTATSGRVVCYASDRIRNPTGTQGYDWRVETDGYTDVFIDPILLDRDPGQYIYVAIEGIQTDNNFSLNSTQGDHRGLYLFQIQQYVQLYIIIRMYIIFFYLQFHSKHPWVYQLHPLSFTKKLFIIGFHFLAMG